MAKTTDYTSIITSLQTTRAKILALLELGTGAYKATKIRGREMEYHQLSEELNQIEDSLERYCRKQDDIIRGTSRRSSVRTRANLGH